MRATHSARLILYDYITLILFVYVTRRDEFQLGYKHSVILCPV